MGSRTLNLTGEEVKAAQGGGFPTLPAGTYGAVVYDAKDAVSKASKTDMYVIDFKITEGPAGINRRQRAWFSHSPKALFKLVELFKATGFPYPEKDSPKDKKGNVVVELPDADEFLGIDVNITLAVEEYASVEEVEDVAEYQKAHPDAEIYELDGVPHVDVTKDRNTVAKVTKYNADKISGAEGSSEESGLFL